MARPSSRQRTSGPAGVRHRCESDKSSGLDGAAPPAGLRRVGGPVASIRSERLIHPTTASPAASGDLASS